MADWRLAPTLVVFRDEVNERYPGRDKTSDGTLGNASHAAGSSDHNPDARGVVCAIDIDEDLLIPAGPYPSFHKGRAAAPLVAEIIANAKAGLTPQLYYVIYEGKIYSRTYRWREQDYDGPSLHDHHFHISVYHPAKYADSTKPWGISDMPLNTEDLAKIKKLLLSEDVLNAVADAVAKRDGNVVNNFTANPANTHVSIGTALGVLGERTKPKA